MTEKTVETPIVLTEFGKTLAVKRRDGEAMMCLWFYEWHMFDAVLKGDHTHAQGKFPWQVNSAGTKAVAEAPCLKLTVTTTADGADLLLEVENESGHDWPETAAIIPCFTPGSVAGPNANVNFYDEDHKRTYFVAETGPALLKDRELHINAELEDEMAARAVDGLHIFSHKWPPSDVSAVEGLMMRESADGKWVAGIAWDDYLTAQGHNPWKCMHLSVRVGPLKQGESKKVRGKIYLFEGGKDDCLRKYRSEFR